MFIQPVKNKGVENKGPYLTLEDVLCRVEDKLGFREVPDDWVSCLTGEYYTTAYNIQKSTNLDSWKIVSAFLNGWYRQIERMLWGGSVCRESMQVAIKGMVNEPYSTDDGTADEIANILIEMLVRKYRTFTPNDRAEKVYPKSYWEGRIEEIMKDFDFNRVLETMKALNWSWCMNGGKSGIPNITQLREEARKQLKEAVRCGEWVACGGFQVMIKPENGYLALLFIVEEAESWKEDE